MNAAACVQATPGSAGVTAGAHLVSALAGAHGRRCQPLHGTLGARVALRPYEVGNARAVLEAIEESRESLVRWVPTIGRRRTLAEVRACLTRLGSNASRQQVFAIWERDTNHFLGEVGLYEIDRRRAAGEIGYWLRAAARGHGYIREALGVVLRHVCKDKVVSCVEARIAAENLASRRVVEEAGFFLALQFVARQDWEAFTTNMLVYRKNLSNGSSNNGRLVG